MLRQPFKIGTISLPSNIFCAPLAGCSDMPFRKMTTMHKPGLVFCEMVKMDALIRHDPKTYQMLDFETSMHPIGAQLCGSKPAIAGKAARILEELGFDTIDLNCGCPVDKVTKDGSGSGLLKNISLIGDILSNIIAAVKIPVTIKIRAGWNDRSLMGPQIVRLAESLGAAAITIHGRTREQGYSGSANLDWIYECKKASKTIPIIGNGDLFSPQNVEKMFLHTECDGVLIARGTLGSPWIIEDIYRHFLKEKPILRTPTHYRNAFLQHLEYVSNYHPPQKTVQELRRIGCFYLKQGKGVKPLREALNKSTSLEEIRSLISHYPWDTTNFSNDNFAHSRGEGDDNPQSL
jgi:tRNA-dihydrouridine synthase B